MSKPINEYFQCDCSSDEHSMVFHLDEDCWDGNPEIYTSVFLQPERNIFKRLWIAIRYMFGYRSKYGAFDCFIMQLKDADKMIRLCEAFKVLAARHKHPQLFDPDRYNVLERLDFKRVKD